MPVPFVNVGSDILKAYMEGRQMMMARQQLMMEQQRLEEEKRFHDLQNQHNLASLAEEAKWHGQNYDLMRKDAERLTAQAEFKKNMEARQGIQQGLVGLAPGQPGIDTSSPQSVGASLANAPTSLPSNAPLNLPAMPGTSPADLTAQTIQTPPTSAGAISGEPMGPALPPVTPGLQNGPQVNVQQTPGQDVHIGGVTIPAAEAAAIPIKPPMSEADKLAYERETQKQLETQRQVMENKQLEAQQRFHELNYRLENQRIQGMLDNTRAMREMTQNERDRRRMEFILNKADSIQKDPSLKNLGTVPVLQDFISKVSQNGGEGTGIGDLEALDAVSKVLVNTPLANLTNIDKLASNTNTTIANIFKKFKGMTDPSYVVLDPAQRIALANQAKTIVDTQVANYKNIYDAHSNAIKALYPEMTDDKIRGFTPHSGILPTTPRNVTKVVK